VIFFFFAIVVSPFKRIAQKKIICQIGLIILPKFDLAKRGGFGLIFVFTTFFKVFCIQKF